MALSCRAFFRQLSEGEAIGAGVTGSALTGRAGVGGSAFTQLAGGTAGAGAASCFEAPSWP